MLKPLIRTNKLRRNRFFSTSKIAHETDVLIVGAGPVGMVLSSILNDFNVKNTIIERTAIAQTKSDDHNTMHQNHPKAHYLSFRTCEILKDLGLDRGLERRIENIEQWTNFNYKSHVIGDEATNFGRVNHFKWFCRKNGLQVPRSKDQYKSLFKSWQDDPGQSPSGAYQGGFTHAYSNHYSQNKLNKDLINQLH